MKTMTNDSTPAAMRAAKALYPSGIGSYCYTNEEHNQQARERDWLAIARKIDKATGLPGLLTSMERCTAGLQIACANLNAGVSPETAGNLYSMQIDAEEAIGRAKGTS